MSVYRGDMGWSCWADVVGSFGCNEPEPEQVIFAEYIDTCYSGSAVVVYRNGDKVYEVTGSHCSCYGLEGQWDPDEYDIDIYRSALGRRSGGNSMAILTALS